MNKHQKPSDTASYANQEVSHLIGDELGVPLSAIEGCYPSRSIIAAGDLF